MYLTALFFLVFILLPESLGIINVFFLQFYADLSRSSNFSLSFGLNLMIHLVILFIIPLFVFISWLTNILKTTEYFSCPQLFDMKKFQSNVNRELRRAYPDRRRLETQCLSAMAFVKSESDLLECPIWVMIINVVAMDMLKSKLPPGKKSFLYISISQNFVIIRINASTTAT